MCEREWFAAVAQPAVRAVTVDLDRARLHELVAVPGLGRRTAEAILIDRIRHGRFECLENLVRVDGIGPATVERVRPFLRCGVDP